MDLDETCTRFRNAGLLLATVTVGSLIAIGYASFRPKGRAKRLERRLDRKLERLETRLRLAG